MQVQRPIRVEDALLDPRHYRKLDADKGFVTQSILGVPLKVKNRVIGVLEVLNKRQLPWTEADEDYLSILADQAAVAIESAQLVTALQRANRELSELDKLKSDFIAIASHELRTPLSVILGYASFLKQTSDGEVSEHATKVMDSALQLRRIIEDMISLSYLKEGAAEIVPDEVLLSELIDEALEEIQALCDAKGHELRVEGAIDGLVVYVDSVRIGKALTNVMNNAVRFTPDGGCITIHTEQRDHTEAWITVSDNGIGLTESQLDLIFNEFYQAADHMTRQHGGLGIGLSIARALVVAHGGRIWANSEGLGKGTALTMTLPLAQAADSR
jgi:signal transduction histidine kinase